MADRHALDCGLAASGPSAVRLHPRVRPLRRARAGTHMKLGIRLESLAIPVRKGLAEAERLGVAGVQVDAAGDLAPDRLTATGRREFRHLLRGRGLELTAL